LIALRARMDLLMIKPNPKILYNTWIDSPMPIPSAVASPALREPPKEFLIIRIVDGPGLIRANKWIPKIGRIMDNMK